MYTVQLGDVDLFVVVGFSMCQLVTEPLLLLLVEPLDLFLHVVVDIIVCSTLRSFKLERLTFAHGELDALQSLHEPLVTNGQILLDHARQSGQVALDSDGEVLQRDLDGGDVMLLGLGGELFFLLLHLRVDVLVELFDGLFALGCCDRVKGLRPFDGFPESLALKLFEECFEIGCNGGVPAGELVRRYFFGQHFRLALDLLDGGVDVFGVINGGGRLFETTAQAVNVLLNGVQLCVDAALLSGIRADIVGQCFKMRFNIRFEFLQQCLKLGFLV
ncbi:methionine synthase, putative [Babesia ovata]|uniref:Methionine synthase, putative n=1 Tax=Babesia ovata TaxID=189622 RepID=A0A2H6KJF5_9APIC|nr:methionine synthase, putative [Babesia ovata]GBE63118.1 methionine synthase, putative [Babesia ovata]